MTEPKTFILPDLIKYCPFEYRINPHYENAKLAAERWLHSYGVLNIEKINKSLLPRLTAMVHDTVDAERLCVLANYYQWVFIFDDLFDDGKWSKSPEDAKNAANLTMNIIREPDTFQKTAFVPAEMMRSIMLGIKKTANKACYRRFIEHTQKYLDAVVEQVTDRAKNIKLNIDTYIELRRNTAALPSSFALTEYAMDLDIPDEVMNNSTIQKLLLYCNDICSFANDIYSFNIEQSWGATLNLVIIAMAEGQSLQQSIDFVGDVVKQRLDAYVAEKFKIPSWGSEVDQKVAIYLSSIERWVVGFLQWSFETDRYFGNSNEKVKQTRMVMMLPLQPEHYED